MRSSPLRHTQLGSTTQEEEHPSPSSALPSSHASPPVRTPSPQMTRRSVSTGTRQAVERQRSPLGEQGGPAGSVTCRALPDWSRTSQLASTSSQSSSSSKPAGMGESGRSSSNMESRMSCTVRAILQNRVVSTMKAALSMAYCSRFPPITCSQRGLEDGTGIWPTLFSKPSTYRRPSVRADSYTAVRNTHRACGKDSAAVRHTSSVPPFPELSMHMRKRGFCRRRGGRRGGSEARKKASTTPAESARRHSPQRQRAQCGCVVRCQQGSPGRSSRSAGWWGPGCWLVSCEEVHELALLCAPVRSLTCALQSGRPTPAGIRKRCN